MVRRIIWSRKAQNDRKEIFKYWSERNKSTTYNRKLNELFIRAAELIARHPRIGRKTDRKNVRVKVVRDYILLYTFTDNEIRILTIFDTRQDPDKIQESTRDV